jgi:hypothetical protein
MVTHDSAEALLFTYAREKMQVELRLLQKRITVLEKAFGVGKICPGCSQPEGVVEFGRNYSRSDGKQVYCRTCRKAKPVSGQRHIPSVSPINNDASAGSAEKAGFGNA